MNKLYSVITKLSLFALLLGAGASLKAQTLTGANIVVTTSKTWTAAVGGSVTTCNACVITISNNATLTINTPVTFGSNNPTVGGGSIINVTGSSKLTIGNGTSVVQVNLINSSIVVGDASTSTTNINPGTASLFVSNNGTLTTTDIVSHIWLANQNNTITAGAGGGGAAAGVITYSNGAQTGTFFSGNNANNIIHFNPFGSSLPYSTTTALITGPALSNVGFAFGQPVASFGTSPVILPITLVDFAASLNSDGGVDLTWATDQEENSSYFNIQRSVNGGTWTNVGKVAAQGNSSLKVDYAYTDVNPGAGSDAYRLQSVDLDGKSAYSEVKVIRTTTQSAGFSVFPNPARDQVNVSLTSAVSDGTIRLVDLSGRVLLEQKVTNAANTIVTVPVMNFPKGTYVLVVRTTNGTQFTGKVLITH